ncbi:hypothetical protein EIB18_09955 [Caulobacter vibrioides]|uniref:Uncharacterized protein n=1 Tax=Caulobacter vibrioides (strain NA1000 / CB15N) TaxID=565050 RepID=A0A0H3J457_CAUVN|nr:hypothetical protein [Caulobacter vibrioides]YP_009020531.1 hypothetical protein CCNA_03959 [Caulobacter vibrioides NA1000]AHI88562.1 hypothetical protein CCNA_03959 [Caulobacter vibrioides NA1000]ATC24843.1 hypothetical protein CA608_10085 [Caulobacter vibrioides]ATC28752.1 hypothetical protein CA607_10295 [Caulobacter vibrioides]AZH13002.1 hypothetical protein EIB18_09955 [Caulobacter vibrioides]PLR09620.1 hypothetical protein CVUC_15510 [Caulobacter vibrioides]
MGCAAPDRLWHLTLRNRADGATVGDARALHSYRRPGQAPAARRGDFLYVEEDADRRSTRRRDACGRRGRYPG